MKLYPAGVSIISFSTSCSIHTQKSNIIEFQAFFFEHRSFIALSFASSCQPNRRTHIWENPSPFFLLLFTPSLFFLLFHPFPFFFESCSICVILVPFFLSVVFLVDGGRSKRTCEAQVWLWSLWIHSRPQGGNQIRRQEV
jgi:hypothetical protein